MSDETITEETKENIDELEAVDNGEEVTSSDPPTLEEQLAAAQAEAADFKDRWLRGQAEFANARKRMDKQRMDAYSNATANVMTKLLPVVDDFERAMANIPADIKKSGWLEGIQLVQRKLETTLENFNVTPIKAVGEPFDPTLHEAITQEPSDKFESGVVSRVVQTGYKIGDRVIRPSLVVVAA